MLTKRIIPCLDIQDGRTVKGVNFINLRDAGDPVELAASYAQQGADELVLLDISATTEKRKPFSTLVKEVARHINIPFTVGGGINSLSDVSPLLEAGADKVSVNSALVKNPKLIDDLSRAFGSQCIVAAIDARTINHEWMVHTHGGKKQADKNLFDWATECENRGAGELLFTSMDHDGTKNGFAINALATLHERLTIPVIASGGAGSNVHFKYAFVIGKADGTLAASIFHFGEIKIPELKKYLSGNNIPVRL